MRLRVLHLIAGLPTGGAEMMLYKLLSRTYHDSWVVSMTDVGRMGERIRELGIPVIALGMRRGIPDPRGLLEIIRILRRERPHVVQTWMYHADVMGGIAAWLGGGIPVVWNIRQSTLDSKSSKRGTVLTFRVAAALSRWLPERIVCCSEAGMKVHAALGYAREKIVLIPNGFDLQSFRPDPEARAAIRGELGIPQEAPLVGLVARFDPQKDHANFVEAAVRLLRVFPEVHFLLCGEGVVESNPEFTRRIAGTGVRDRFHLLGRREDVPRVTAALDVATSSSYQEGFPNVIGEAMACGIPCVVTDVGDSAGITADTGITVPPHDPAALADGWRRILGMPREERRSLGERARQRILERFALERVVSAYEELYENLAQGTTTCVE